MMPSYTNLQAGWNGLWAGESDQVSKATTLWTQDGTTTGQRWSSVMTGLRMHTCLW